MDWFKIGKGVCQGLTLFNPAYLTYVQSTSCEMLGWMKHKLELRLPGEILIILETDASAFIYAFIKNSLTFFS